MVVAFQRVGVRCEPIRKATGSLPPEQIAGTSRKGSVVRSGQHRYELWTYWSPRVISLREGEVIRVVPRFYRP